MDVVQVNAPKESMNLRSASKIVGFEKKKTLMYFDLDDTYHRSQLKYLIAERSYFVEPAQQSSLTENGCQ